MQNVRGIYKTKPIKKDVHRSSMFDFMLTKTSFHHFLVYMLYFTLLIFIVTSFTAETFV